MGDTDRPSRERKHGTEARACRARTLSYETYYRSLVQLAALLTGDAGAAEAAVADALAAVPRWAAIDPGSDESLRYLQRQVVIQCRRRRRYRGAARHDAASDFARLPVVIALRGLPSGGREAIVLTHYLDLPPAQAATVAGVSEAVLRANLTTAMRAMDDQVTEPYLGS